MIFGKLQFRTITYFPKNGQKSCVPTIWKVLKTLWKMWITVGKGILQIRLCQEKITSKKIWTDGRRKNPDEKCRNRKTYVLCLSVESGQIWMQVLFLLKSAEIIFAGLLAIRQFVLFSSRVKTWEMGVDAREKIWYHLRWSKENGESRLLFTGTDLPVLPLYR